MQRMSRAWCLLAVMMACVTPARAEDGSAAWLRYERIADASVRQRYARFSGPIAALGDSRVIRAARDELARGVASMLGRELPPSGDRVAHASVVIGPADAINRRFPLVRIPALTEHGAFWLGDASIGKRHVILVAGRDDRGVLYGVFTLLRHLALRDAIDMLNE